MSIKKISVFWIVIVLIFSGLGLYTRNNFKRDFLDGKMSRGLENVKVAQMPVEYKEILKFTEEAAMDCQTVLLVEAQGKPKFVYKNTLQTVKIKKVLKNNKNYEFSEELTISGQGLIGSDDSMNMSFVNFMEKGNEYVVFLRKKLEAVREEDGDVFELEDKMSMCQILSVKDGPVLHFPEDIYVNYSKVKDNEFFAKDEEAEKMIRDFKKRIFNELGIET